MPDLSHIQLLQGNKKLSFAEPKLELLSDQQFVISIPKEVVTVHLKSIIATLTDPTDSRKTYSVLLRLNKEKTAYEAVIAPLMVEGMSQITIDIYDYQAAVVGTYKKTVTFVEGHAVLNDTTLSLEGFIVKMLPVFLAVLIPLLIGTIILLFYKRRHAHEDNNNW